MRFTLALLTGALAALASAQNPFNIPDGGLNVTVGVPVNLSWVPTSAGTVSLYLRDGPEANLNPGIQLASGIINGGSFKFTPTVANSVAHVAYTIEIVDDTNQNRINFTPRFYINTGSVAPTVAAENTDGGSRLNSRQNSALNFALVASEAFAVAEESTEMASGSGAGRVEVCGGVLVLLGCFFVVVM